MAREGKKEAVMATEGPPLGLLVREKHRAYVTPFPYDVGTEGAGESLPEAREAQFSPAGDYFVAIEGENLAAVVRDAVTAKVVASCGGLEDKLAPLKINFATFSPRGTFLLTWSRPVAGVSVENLVIYRTATGERIGAFHQKLFHVDFWASIQWSNDETIAARAVTNTIHFFDGASVGGVPTAKLGIPGVSKFALSGGSEPFTIAAFVPGVKGAPGRISLFKHPDQGGAQLVSRSTFRADSVTFKWNSLGTAVLALISTNVDTSGKSYYGESEVYFMNSEGTVAERVNLPQEGPTYDAAWSPTGFEFIIIYGFMPACATMFNDKCQAIFDFGTGSRNTISFSPHGRFVALAGFGNLAGVVEFWDKNKTVLVGRAQMSCTTAHSWSPCSRYFLGATTFPRLRVDNGFRIVRYDGRLIHEHKLTDSMLLQAVFRPALRGTYQDPKLTNQFMIGGPPQAASVASAAGPDPEKKKAGVYRPPGGRGSSASFSLHQHKEAGKVDKTGFMSSGSGFGAAPARTSGGKKVVPGMDPAEYDKGPSKSALKKQKKKERERQAQLEAEAEAAKANAPPPAIEDLESAEAAEKRAKGIKKKLRQIESLRASQAEGKELVDVQLAKIANAAALEEDLAKVEQKLKDLKGYDIMS